MLSRTRMRSRAMAMVLHCHLAHTILHCLPYILSRITMRFGEPASFTVETVDKKGRGRGHIGAREACAYFAVPGERVEGTLYARRQGGLFVSTDHIADPSPHPLTPPCA